MTSDRQKQQSEVCTACKQPVDPSARRCPHCQSELEQTSLVKKAIIGLGGIGMITGILLIVVEYITGDAFWGDAGLGLIIVVAVGVVVAQFLRKTITLILGGLLRVFR